MSALELFYTGFVPYFLFAVMVAMGLTLGIRDIKQVFVGPKPMLVGLSAQLFALPVIAILLGFLFASPAVIAAGAIIVAACPGGITSNAYTFASKADVALSVSMTLVSSAITIFTIPLLCALAMQLHMDSVQIPQLPVGKMIFTLAKFTIIPVSIGILIRAWNSKLADKLIEPLRIATVISLLIIIVIGTITSWDTIVKNFWQAGILVITINISAMLLGYGLGKKLQLPTAQVASITFEVGVQNVAMALFVSLTFLKSPDLAIATLVYALIMKLTAFFAIWYFRRQL